MISSFIFFISEVIYLTVLEMTSKEYVVIFKFIIIRIRLQNLWNLIGAQVGRYFYIYLFSVSYVYRSYKRMHNNN